MNTVVSADGTVIAFDRYGEGLPVIMTAGAFNTRTTTEPLAKALASQFAVLNYDRRGRGDSGDTRPYAVEREIDDIAALIAAAGSASLFGYSSGATLALKAAASGLPVTKLVLYEPPFNTDDSHPVLPADLPRQLAELVSAGRRGDAVELYQTTAVGIPADVVAQMRHAPFRPAMEAIAHTLAYEAAIVGDRSLPAGLLASVTIPALVVTGEQSPPFLRAAAQATHADPAGRAAGHLFWPDPRHRPRSHRAGHSAIPRQLTQATAPAVRHGAPNQRRCRRRAGASSTGPARTSPPGQRHPGSLPRQQGRLDELQLLVHPVVVGTGKHPFEDGNCHVPPSPSKGDRHGNGVIAHRYRRRCWLRAAAARRVAHVLRADGTGS